MTDQNLSSPTAVILDEGPLGMAAAARKLGIFRDEKATHPSTLTRWAKAGVRLPDGRIVKLETIQLPGRLVTSWPAVVRFIEAQQTDAIKDGEIDAVRGPAARRRHSESADAELQRMGC